MDISDILAMALGISPAMAQSAEPRFNVGSGADAIMRSAPQPLEFSQPGPMLPPSDPTRIDPALRPEALTRQGYITSDRIVPSTGAPAPTPMPTPVAATPQPTVASTPVGSPYQEAYRSSPMTGPYQEDYRSQPAPATLGAALEPRQSGVPMPMPRPAEAPKAGEVPPGQSGDALLKTLRGVQAPAAPTPQRVATPHLPALRPIQGGGYLDLLLAMNQVQQKGPTGLNLPSTLGQALAGR